MAPIYWKLLKIKSVQKSEIKKELKELSRQAMKQLKINEEDVKYLVFPVTIQNETYNFIDDEIKFLKKNNTLINLSDIKKEFTINTKNSSIIKHYICYPKVCS